MELHECCEPWEQRCKELEAQVDRLELDQSGYDQAVVGYKEREYKLNVQIDRLIRLWSDDHANVDDYANMCTTPFTREMDKMIEAKAKEEAK